MKNSGNIHLANNLKRLRKQSGLTQHTVADALGIERSRYAHYESGTTPTADNLRKLARVFNITIDELLSPPSTIDFLRETDTSLNFESFIFNELKNDEKSLVIKYRLLSPEAKSAILKSLEVKLDKET